MWRHLSRGFQQSIKRSLCLEKQDVLRKEVGPNQYQCCLTKLLPKSFQSLDPHILNQHDGDKYKEGEDESSTKSISNHTFLEAFGWSGALVFGWVISKRWWCRHICSQDLDSCSNNDNRIAYRQTLINILAHVVTTQPPVNYVLPQLQSLSSEPTCKENSVEDEFESAAKELQEIHNKAIGESLNRRGIAYISKSAGVEAIKYFKQASELKYPPASFNLGQCCELGIGMKQDFKQAAEWYKIASEQGHPTAMYNLGVFYAHGWGGLPSDITIARNLFVKAAELGQPDAKVALDNEARSSHNVLLKIKNPQIPMPALIENFKTKPAHSQSSKFEFFVHKIRDEMADNIFTNEYATNNSQDVPFKTRVAI